MQNPYKENTKIYNLYEQIKQIDKLKHLLGRPKVTRISECALKTRKYPFLNDYIDEYFKLYPNKINFKDGGGNTILMVVSCYPRRSTCKTIKILLDHGADINAESDYGNIALLLASGNTKNNSTYHTVKLLLNRGANINLRNRYGETALMYAVKCLRTTSTKKTVKLLLDHGADINIQDMHGDTALMYAIDRSPLNKEIISLLLKYKPDVNIVNKSGSNALLILLQWSTSKTVIRQLINHGIDTEAYFFLWKENAITKIFSDKKYISVIDIILPYRKIFIEKTNKYKNVIREYEFWRVKSCDFKIIFTFIHNYKGIINFM